MVISFSILVIIGFLILSAFFSGSETAFFSLSKIHLKKLEKDEVRSAKRIIRLLSKPRELLIIILLGNTIVNVAASSTAALIAIHIGELYLKNLPQSYLLTIEIITMTILLLILGEITPKLIAYSFPQKFAKFSGFILEIIKYTFWPLIKILEWISYIFSTRSVRNKQEKFTKEDFKNIIKSKIAKNSLEENEKKIITSIFRFSQTLTREIMVPRVDIVAVEHSDGLEKVIEMSNITGHSKIPIFKKSIDNITGIIYAKDVIIHPDRNKISSLQRSPLIVTENVKIQNLLNQFKKLKLQIAIVVDEYGGTAGMITLEDILEELVGEIRDELDKEKPLITEIAPHEFALSGMYSISELNDSFELDLDNEEYDNLADFLFDQFNKVPKVKEQVNYKNKAIFTVTEIDGQRITYARMKILDKNKKY